MDGTAITWFIDNAGWNVIAFCLVLAVIYLCVRIYRHEQTCIEAGEKRDENDAKFRAEVRNDLGTLNGAVSRIEGYIRGKSEGT